MKLSNEFKVGILVLATFAMLIAGYQFLQGTTLLKKGDFYTIEYAYIPGLKKGDPIQIKGYQIGRVTDIVLPNAQSENIEVIVNITEIDELPSDSRAIIRSADLLGEKYIDLILGKSDSPLNSDTHIKGEIEADLTNQIKDELKPLTEKVQSMIVSVDTAITVMSSIFTPSFKDNFENSVRSIKQTLESLNNTARVVDELLVSEQKKIEGIIGDVSDITGNIDNNEASLNTLISNLSAISTELAAIDWETTGKSLQAATLGLDSILTQINQAEGSLGKLVYEDDLYQHLNALSINLENISKELQANPGKYMPALIQIGGKKDP